MAACGTEPVDVQTLDGPRITRQRPPEDEAEGGAGPAEGHDPVVPGGGHGLGPDAIPGHNPAGTQNRFRGPL